MEERLEFVKIEVKNFINQYTYSFIKLIELYLNFNSLISLS